MLNMPVEEIQRAYLILLALTLPISLWAFFSDLKHMKIPNRAVYALAGVWLVAGALLFPLDAWAWRWVNAVAVYFVGYILYALRAPVGAGDAKFAAAAAPFVFPNHVGVILVSLSMFSIAALIAHRTLRAIPAVVRATPDWASWKRGKNWLTEKFPFGLALVATFVFYLCFVALPPVHGWVASLMSR